MLKDEDVVLWYNEEINDKGVDFMDLYLIVDLKKIKIFIDLVD